MRRFVVAVLLACACLGHSQGRVPQGIFLLTRSDVQKELALSKVQRTRLDAMVEGLRRSRASTRDASNRGGSGRGEPTNPEFSARLAQTNAKAMALLTPQQKTRFEQIQVQTRGLWSLESDTVAKKLALTSKQRDTIRKNLGTFATSGGVTPKKGQTAAQIREAGRSRYQSLEKSVMAALTASQRAQWIKLQGKPFRLQPIPVQAGPMIAK